MPPVRSRCSYLPENDTDRRELRHGDGLVAVRRVGRELGVGYVLEGSVRRDDRWLRICGQLIDATSGAHLWADRFEGDLSDVFELQDRITESVVAAIEPTLQLAEIKRHNRKRPNKIDAYDLLLRAYGLEYEFTAESKAAALGCLDQARAVDPNYVPAMAAAAYCQAQRHFPGMGPQDGTHRTKAVSLAWRAVELASNDAQVLGMAAFAVWNMARSDHHGASDMTPTPKPATPMSATQVSTDRYKGQSRLGDKRGMGVEGQGSQ